tara:strand:- start:2702 stop:3571 length:870 start_codon:yes stop_codon:yes gene_type:complete
MKIKNLVISGGGYNGLCVLGVLNELMKSNYIEYSNIEKIYGTSVGSIVGLIYSLNINLEDLKAFMINRPWNNFVDVSFDNIIKIIEKKGLLDGTFIKKFVKKLFNLKEISTDITFNELYEYSHIELHTYHVELNKYELVDCNYKTKPDMKVLEAVYYSCSLPYLFSPGKYNNDICLDGGLLCSFPLNICLEENKEEETLGIEICQDSNLLKINDKSNIFEYSFFIFLKMLKISNKKQKEIKNYIRIERPPMSFKESINLIKSKEKREALIIEGEEVAKKYLESRVNKIL